MKKIFKYYFFWRLYITLAMISGLALPVKTGFLGGGVKNYFQSPLTWSFANFDGVHYLSIAAIGYRQFEQAFFPLYPLLIKLISLFTLIDYVKIGLFISHAAFFFGFYFFYRLLRTDYGGKKTNFILLFLLFFPTTFYFAAVYTESLFFLLTVGCFLAARKGFWLVAGIAGALASATRVSGILLFPALIFEYIWQHRASSAKKKQSNILSFLWLFLIPLGLLLYMYWLNANFGDPLYFFHAQPAFGAERSDKIILLPQVFFRYLKIFFTAAFNYQYFISAVEFFTAVIFFALSIYGFKILRPSYALYAFFSLLLPTLTGTFSSLPRYVLTIFPLFLVINHIISDFSQRAKTLVFVFFPIMLFLFTMLFTRGFWVG